MLFLHFSVTFATLSVLHQENYIKNQPLFERFIMNYINIIPSTLAFLAFAVYAFKSYQKLSRHGMPFLKAFNPWYDIERYRTDELKKSLSPIVSELETSRMANFINLWKNKFENNTLTIKDVEFLNEQIAAGNINQVNGILALHPEASKMYDTLNETLNPIEKDLIEEELQAV